MSHQCSGRTPDSLSNEDEQKGSIGDEILKQRGAFHRKLDKFALDAIEELYRLCSKIPDLSRRQMYTLYCSIMFRLVWSVLRAVSASQISLRRPKHLILWRSWKSLTIRKLLALRLFFLALK